MQRKRGDEHGKISTSMTMSSDSTVLQKPLANMGHTGRTDRSSSALPSTKSTPATPAPRAQSQVGEGQSPTAQNATRESSPRSQNSESSQTTHLSRRPRRGCRFETGMAQARRRVPYSLGPDRLSPEPERASVVLSQEDGQKLTQQIENLYGLLVPSEEGEDRRKRFVQKLDQLLRSRWSDAAIKVSVFGSTGNYLGTNDSDVDICITTDCKEIENVCLIAELLAQNGMQRIVCVSSARVPIVKAWDPQFQMACDINVNNPIALENTQMIRAYIQIDHRVRPLAIVIKHWAKKRILNDAALGGTLSSYTWICMLLNFLQTRQPPILPTLQQKDGLQPVILGGVNVAFDKELGPYANFGAANTASLGDLLFQFFKYFGHELNFEENAISVRLGKVIPKSQKAWHLLQDNRLCVEEPFNTSRNLANTADDTSMRGIHLELRRGFQLLAAGDLDQCCEEYVRGPEEPKQTATFVQQAARPIIPQAPTQSTTSSTRSRNGIRSMRNSNRNSGARRSSNPASRNPNYLHDLPFQMTPQELQLQAQHQQHLLHDQLFQQYQYLQLQEQELRMQLYQQNLRQRGMMSSQKFASPLLQGDGGMRLPISPNLYQNRFGNTSPFLTTSPTPANGVMTNPASPLLGHAVPDHRRFSRRTSVATSNPAASLRAHSQPARSVAGGAGLAHSRPVQDAVSVSDNISERRSSIASQASTANLAFMPHQATSSTLYDAGRRAEFMGYYVGQSPSLVAHSQSTTISPIPSHAGLAIHHGGLSPRMSTRSSQVASGNSSPALPPASLGNGHDQSRYATATRYPPSPPLADGPLIIDGSLKSPKRRQQAQRDPVSNSDNYTVSTTMSDDNGIDTPATSEDQFNDLADKPSSSTNGIFKAHNIDDVLTSFRSTSSLRHQGEIGSEPVHAPAFPTTRDEYTLSQDSTPTSVFSPEGRMQIPGEMASHSSYSTRKKGGADRSPTAAGREASAIPPLHNRTNGQHVGSKESAATRATDAATAWHTQKKKRKAWKATKSEADVSALNSAGGELLPLDESLRKGG